MDALDYAFDSFKDSAVRIETLPEYAIYDTNEYMEFNNYRNGNEINGFANQSWLDDITKWKSENKTIKRIRVIPKDISEYFTYEVNFCYPRNLSAGEDIYFIKNDIFERISNLYKIKHDIWFFDGELIVVLNYNDKYEYLDCFQQSDKMDIMNYKNYLAKIMESVISYNSYINDKS